jgi:hypothetical protein
MSDSKPSSQKIRVVLTDRAPVLIASEDWPLIASAKDWDNQYEFQANRTWTIRVRQHARGCALVYAIYTTQYQGSHDVYGGQKLQPGADVARAIHEVAAHMDTLVACPAFSGRLAEECIANLPAEDCGCDSADSAVISAQGDTSSAK